MIAVVLAGIAAFFLHYGNKDAAFITIVFGCVSFFFSIRAQSKLRVEKENSEIIAKKYGDHVSPLVLNEGVSFDAEFNKIKDAEKIDEAN